MIPASTRRGRDADNNMALEHVIEGWLGGFPSRDAAVAALETERVPCAPVLTVHEAMAHPHLRQRGTVRRVRDETIGAFDIPGLPVKIFPLGGAERDSLPTVSASVTKRCCESCCA